MLPHPLTNFEIQKYYPNEPTFNGVYFRNNLPKKIKDLAYVINLDDYADVDTHQVSLCRSGNKTVYYNSLGAEHVPDEIKDFVVYKIIKPDIFRVQATNSVMCEYFYIGFIDFMTAGKKLIYFTSLFSPHDFEKTDSIILGYFKND